ncbi:macro domain-containing protein [Bacillus sp. JJ1503]|uniref:macro domain-containing protein n=1 Tax=Bacillus sp. JJ1503 TaxID=3122956 RepID=UPI002FFD697D
MRRTLLKIMELIVSKGFWQKAWIVPSILFAVATTFLTFVDINEKKYLLYVLIIVTLIYFIIYIFKASSLNTISLDIDGSQLEIVSGDIFNQESDSFKVIAFNEYFDTKVDDNIISSNSLNGQYILKKYPLPKDLKGFNRRLANDQRLRENIKQLNVERKLGGNSTRYELGSVYKDDDYFLVAFSKFNELNVANLKLAEYATCLMKFWSEVNSLYNRKTVVLPLLGSGITRHNDFNANNQELLEVLIWTFKISKVKFREPSKIRIVIHESQIGEINFYKLKELEKNGI